MKKTGINFRFFMFSSLYSGIFLLSPASITEEGAKDEAVVRKYFLGLKYADGDGHYAPSRSNLPNDDCNGFNPSICPGSTDYMCGRIGQNRNGMVDESHEVAKLEYQAGVDAAVCMPHPNPTSATRNPCSGAPEYDAFHVININLDMADIYGTWADKRLPTEAQWEYAARGGLAGKRYPWGDTLSRADVNYYFSGAPRVNDTAPVRYGAANG